jgi:succinate dehydrogenase / fumarate reductase cytochrome b subunit
VKTPLQVKKRNMALAGALMTVYLIFHMLSNLSFFCEQQFTAFYEWYNGGVVRWLILAIMVFAVGLHVKTAMMIRKVNAQARRIDYTKHDSFKIPAHFVTMSIIFLLAFIVIHIIQTLQFDISDTYNEVIYLFQSPLITLFYLAGLFVLLMHLQHSLANLLQTLGKTSKTNHVLVWVACLVLIGGFASIPLYSYVVMS